MSEISRNYKIKVLLRMVILLSVFLFTPLPASAEPRQEHSAKGAEPDGDGLLQSIKNAVVSEKRSLDELESQLERLATLQKAIRTEINAYKVQNSAHGNLLLFPGPDIKDLERAFGASKQALASIREKHDQIQQQLMGVEALRQQTLKQIEIFGGQRAEVASGPWTETRKKALLDALDSLLEIISNKDAVLRSLFEIQNITIQNLVDVRTATDLIAESLETRIKSRIKQDLFGRRFLLLRVFNIQAVASEWEAVVNKLGGLFKKDFWLDAGSKFREDGAVALFTLAIFVVIGGLFILRLRGFCLQYEARPSVTNKRWGLLCLVLMRRSLFPAGAFMALMSYNAIQFYDVRAPFIRSVCDLLSIFLFARWMLDFLKYWEPRGALLFWLSLKPRIRALARRIRTFALVYFMVGLAVDNNSIFLFAGRLFLEVGLAAWCISFWRVFHQAKRQTAGGPPAPLTPVESMEMYGCHIVAFGGLIIEFVGYPALAEYWYVSWTKSLFVILWAGIFFLVVGEWSRDARKSAKMVEADVSFSVHPVRLLLIQSVWVLWAVALLNGLVLAWGANREVLDTVYGFMKRSWTIGEINLSLMGLIYAFLILFFTYALTRIGRHVLIEKILAKSEMEFGLKDSISTISVYLLRGLGLVLALGVLGVSSTSLAVVFGALSIGIGFGLQTIFNNFISGLILLFERPIQVGDAVEIGSVWGEVKKINVRATVVQTYDNASMIIPNSEFISSQVINWSFKDKRLRRKVGVGVAYGSNIELVRTILLEIAGEIPNVLKYPKPDVLFTDHGDSALVFTLRYWTTVDYYYSTETDIRFEIDRRFREHGIEIAFPQRDIHIRSIVKEASSESEKKTWSFTTI